MPRMRCPRCGGEMNRYAEKLVHPANAAELGLVDVALGGVLKENHALPQVRQCRVAASLACRNG